MTKTDNKAAFDFVVEQLRSDKEQTYSDIKAKAEKQGHTLYPVLYGNAQRVLGIAKPSGDKKLAKKRGRPAGATSGSSKSDQIRELLKTDLTGPEISERVGCSINLVYAVKRRETEGKSGGSSASPKRAQSKVAEVVDSSDLNKFLHGIRAMEKERDELRAVLKKIVDELTPLLS